MTTQSKHDCSERGTSTLVRLFVERSALGMNLSAEQVMIELVKRLRRKCGRAKTTEQRMQLVMKYRGVNRIDTVAELDCDGVLEPVGTTISSGFRMLLRSTSNEKRRRFTVAHELCHTFFYELVPEMKFVHHDTDEEEERLCDMGAADLLMSGRTLRRSARQRPICLGTLCDLADEYSVSIAAMLLRLRSLGIWNCEFSRWQRLTGGVFSLDRLYGGRTLAWRWDDLSILEAAWNSKSAVFGHTFVSYQNDRGVQYCKPVEYEVRRFGNQVFALWGKGLQKVTPPASPLFGSQLEPKRLRLGAPSRKT